MDTRAQVMETGGKVTQMPVGKLGMWLFLLMDGLSFATILIGAAYLRTNGAPWPNPGEELNVPLTAVNTTILMFSSLTMMLALAAVREDRLDAFKKYLWITFGLGACFLGIQAYEYTHLIMDGICTGASIYAGCFYGATGYHGVHVLSGLVFMIYVLAGALKGKWHSGNYGRVETLTLYWHFVDLMWILVFTVVYLL